MHCSRRMGSDPYAAPEPATTVSPPAAKSARGEASSARPSLKESRSGLVITIQLMCRPEARRAVLDGGCHRSAALLAAAEPSGQASATRLPGRWRPVLAHGLDAGCRAPGRPARRRLLDRNPRPPLPYLPPRADRDPHLPAAPRAPAVTAALASGRARTAAQALGTAVVAGHRQPSGPVRCRSCTIPHRLRTLTTCRGIGAGSGSSLSRRQWSSPARRGSPGTPSGST